MIVSGQRWFRLVGAVWGEKERWARGRGRVCAKNRFALDDGSGCFGSVVDALSVSCVFVLVASATVAFSTCRDKIGQRVVATAVNFNEVISGISWLGVAPMTQGLSFEYGCPVVAVFVVICCASTCHAHAPSACASAALARLALVFDVGLMCVCPCLLCSVVCMLCERGRHTGMNAPPTGLP